ncbi:lipopolysaccharide assembly protein LapA domain-containing protein [Paenibacillus thiaminolyticus]|uniref:DUF1049 domain-containing protein n=1 Tax=Paenibacillus thiaminolyticus TaxID=49283 RepID=A0AAP9DSR8_PANTH|nr:lipopolysaccharide assembly protein LapA domain-containing protein [Paenibacillus thiaminolyticus]MCY9533452.1 lipopolysaccharide assembly protein LapA domain-containing protein [Paenibacillus thiaminolyticus]MCY9604117.1 lipopolysaccharide assembly protein LapA domain-containing protein [Paenibacillus thiaminolyticus]MCY9606335.1 lipopolysaccharide assembly protein LapA domain-containing protein [Paenibacillus thiaminolyticus]MCY9612085.1 lipopolysaccharide assembly protein LapA domain-cont
MRIQWSLIAGLIFALITAIFAVINVNPVQVNLLFGTFEVPLILLILGCTLLGAIIVGSYSIYLQYRSQKKIQQLEQQLAQLAPEAEAAEEEMPLPPANEEVQGLTAERRNQEDLA